MTGTSGVGKKSTDFEVNIVPIVDCLTILVTFMLAAGVYYSVAMLDVKVSAGGKSVEAKAPVAVSVSVKLDQALNVTLDIGGKESRHVPIAAIKGRPDLPTLSRNLASLKEKYPDVNMTTLVAHREVEYQQVISVMESIRASHPDVLLGGF
jgi:biopolymer transport protein TolR